METLYERRRFTRWSFEEPVQIRLIGEGSRQRERPSSGESCGSLGRDIGMGGISILTFRFLPRASKVEIHGEMSKGHQHFSGVAKVAWTERISYAEEQYRCGLEFIELTHPSSQVISSYIGKFLVVIGWGLLLGFLWLTPCVAYWEWTPQTGRWINPKYAAKGTPQEQYQWAVGFYQAKDYKKAVREFAKLVKFYPHSEYAPKAQVGLGEAYEGMGEYYQAYHAYQKLLDTYPSYSRVDDIIDREYRIGNLFFEGHKRKLLGFEILPSAEQAIEIFKKVTEMAPYGKNGEAAMVKIGECYKKQNKYTEAREAFETLIRQYPGGEFVDVARFQIALCTVKETKKVHYDQQATDQAIGEFRAFIRNHPSHESVPEAKEIISELQDRKATKSYEIAKFYESQGNPESAKIYYQDIITQFPDSSLATIAKEKLEKMLHGS